MPRGEMHRVGRLRAAPEGVTPPDRGFEGEEVGRIRYHLRVAVRRDGPVLGDRRDRRAASERRDGREVDLLEGRRETGFDGAFPAGEQAGRDVGWADESVREVLGQHGGGLTPLGPTPIHVEHERLQVASREAFGELRRKTGQPELALDAGDDLARHG